MSTHTFTSWGGLSASCDDVRLPASSNEVHAPGERWLAVGNGRSYGDTGLPAGAAAIDTRAMRKIHSFDPVEGVLRAESGILLSEILDAIIPHGWFLPVTPGTRWVTLGGAVANDVHGKNHHKAGTFGTHVRALELVRSNGSRLICSRETHRDMFAATIGGMGLTGIICWIEINLMRIKSAHVKQTSIRFKNLDEYFARYCEADTGHEYSVAWIDSLAKGAALGRGILMLGEHANTPGTEPPPAGDASRKPWLAIPFTPPFAAITPLTLKAFNMAYYRKPLGPDGRIVDYKSYFYPLDGIAGWNRLYGPRGLRQFQCVIPIAEAHGAIKEMLQLAQSSRQGSFLTVLKKFGRAPSPGLLSFPREGFTLTLDFPYRGDVTDALLQKLDAITLQTHGAVNPYKDARMSRAVFEASFPNWKEFTRYMDPQAQSLFSKRIGLMADVTSKLSLTA